MTTKEAKSKSKSAEDLRAGRYLPDGSLNIAGRWKSPGPGRYLLPPTIGYVNHDFTLNRRPAYTIGNKLTDASQDQRSPGPVYLPPADVTKTGRIKAPAYHVTSRPKEYSLWANPGPGTYKPETYKDKAPMYTIGSKHKHLEIPAHPVGPNQYTIPNTIGNSSHYGKIKNAPKFSISSRQKFMSITYGMDETPTKLYNPNLDAVKATPSKWTIAGRNYMPEMASRIPGPNAYEMEKVKAHVRSSPSATMGIRHSEYCSTGLPSHYDNYD